jgi:hypothetical protein
MPPFWISIAVLSILQGGLVTLPRSLRPGGLERLRGRRWAVVPPVSIVAFVLVAGVAERASAQGLTYLALVGVPPLAALALGWLARGARPRHALLLAVLFALAWADRGGLVGESAALLLSGLSCVALGVLLASLTPPAWLSAGVVAMACADAALVIADLLQRPNSALNAAHPGAGLPRLQSAVFGSAVMGYGDLFIAGVTGGLLAASAGRRDQLKGGVLTCVFALAFDLLFFLVDELPATVPVALALIVVLTQRRSAARAQADPAGPTTSSASAPGARAPAVR